MLRVIETDENITVEVKFPHNEESHSEDHSRGLGFLHRHNIVSQIQADPTQSTRSIARVLKNKGQEIPAPHRKKIGHLVRLHQNALLAIELEGVQLDGTIGSMVRLRDALWFEDAVNK